MQQSNAKKGKKEQAVVFQLKNEKINFTHVVEKRERLRGGEGEGGSSLLILKRRRIH
jgi:hypothetical protein